MLLKPVRGAYWGTSAGEVEMESDSAISYHHTSRRYRLSLWNTDTNTDTSFKDAVAGALRRVTSL